MTAHGSPPYASSPNRRLVTADDLDLEPPVKWRPLKVTTTATYVVWVEDWDVDGAVRLAERYSDDPCDLSDLIQGASAEDGGIDAEALDEWDRYMMRGPSHGPWQVCPWPGCGIPQYPAYSVDPSCYRHTVTGCSRRDLPERVFA